MWLDEDGEDFIKGFEKLSLAPYQDEGGVWTIGWGHTEGVSSETPAISTMQAEFFFEDDISAAEETVNHHVKIELSQNEFNALVSFAYNEGIGRFQRSDLLAKLNAGNRAGAAKEFLKYIFYTDNQTGKKMVSNGLNRRRAAEMQLFLQDFNRAREV